MSFLFDKVKGALNDAQAKIKGHAVNFEHKHFHTHLEPCSEDGSHHAHRYQSFAPQREGNDAKWYVDGCGYFYAVSVALEQARESIWILDWWLSPELYLRRPPAKNEQYRLDKMLFQAANRGVQVNIIVYKEVTQALTLSSSHTKHALEDNDKTGNIRVLRHPDHLPDSKTMASTFWSSIKQSGITAAKLEQLPQDVIKGIYGMDEDIVLYWAHHEKMCLIDGEIAFMGGLDLCYGRWDTHQHSIADAHPEDLNKIVFPGQDYNNSRIMDFEDVQHYQNNKLDRKHNSRMGWSDVSLSLRGPVIEDLKAHFAQRWNFIYFEKYDARENARYSPIQFRPARAGIIGHPYHRMPNGTLEGDGQTVHLRDRLRGHYERAKIHIDEHRDRLRNIIQPPDDQPFVPAGNVHVQLLRSCCKWSHGVPVEHSIANAYIETIRDSRHFVYIENQFFITATSDEQKPVQNKIGAAIVERIVRAARSGEKYHIIANIPAIPGFAGDLKVDGSLGTRAIMEFQYSSISRDGSSILEQIARQGIDPMEYIRFYNLRNYDRINASASMNRVEQQAGVSYDDARRGYDMQYAQTVNPAEYGTEYQGGSQNAYTTYQQAAQTVTGPDQSQNPSSGRWDSVAECYMLGGADIRSVPWDGDAQSELDAFVSEELYIHTKLLIADDRVVICGSANLNDRSQLGTHDSEIAVLIEDQEDIDSYMAGQPWRATKYAATLRRHIFRKHLGLLPPQDMERPDANFFPASQGQNVYDWNSREDQAVADPLSDAFMNLWKTTAANNTIAFRRVFHPVPDDTVRNWAQYAAFYERYFKIDDAEKAGKDTSRPSAWKQGHVVAEEFSPGEAGLREVKEVLSTIRGNLVEMPLMFLKELGQDLAIEGLGLNDFTKVLYT